MGIYLRTAHDVSHGLSKFSSLKFFKSLAILALFGIYLRTTYDVSLGLGKISSLKFFKSPDAKSSLGTLLRTIFGMDGWTYKNLKSEILKRAFDNFSSLMLMKMIAP